MKIGLWNIDHPETASGVLRKERRFQEVTDYLMQAACDAYIITEANAAIDLSGYFCELSDESPFKSSSRFYGGANSYHQVAIYCQTPLERSDVDEPINGLLCKVADHGCLEQLYGNVVTIKDQWSKTSSKTYSDRLSEQIDAVRSLISEGTLVGGDFNLRLGWPQKRLAHSRVKEELAAKGWAWPTETREDTVQHVLHSPGIAVDLTIDFDVKYGANKATGLSDHPFIEISLTDATAGGMHWVASEAVEPVS